MLMVVVVAVTAEAPEEPANECGVGASRGGGGGGHLHEGLQVLVEEAGPVTVPEEGNMPEFLRLAARERMHARTGQILPCDPQRAPTTWSWMRPSHHAGREHCKPALCPWRDPPIKFQLACDQ